MYICVIMNTGCCTDVTLGHQCLRFSQSTENWQDAGKACEEIGGKLVSPTEPDTLLDYVVKIYGGWYLIYS